MIEVGEYVRINNDFRLIALGIGKVIRINQDTIYVKMNFELPFAFKIENIVKHSKNIIELIEVGDYVNGIQVKSIINTDLKHLVLRDEIGCIYNQNIKSILTKEQYNQNCYRLEETC